MKYNIRVRADYENYYQVEAKTLREAEIMAEKLLLNDKTISRNYITEEYKPTKEYNYITEEYKNDYDALVEALRLSIIAPDDDKAQECIEIAKSIAANLTQFEVERAKKQADKLVQTFVEDNL